MIRGESEEWKRGSFSCIKIHLNKSSQNSPTTRHGQFSRDSRTLTRDPFTPNLSTIFPDTNRVSLSSHVSRAVQSFTKMEDGCESRFYRTIGSGRRVILPTRRSTEIDEDPPPLVSRTCGNNALSSSSSSSSARGPCRRYRVNPSSLSDNRWNPVKFQFLSFQNLMDEFLECIWKGDERKVSFTRGGVSFVWGREKRVVEWKRRMESVEWIDLFASREAY